jgi:predicted anti-sigma-YlaC factor YlaD
MKSKHITKILDETGFKNLTGAQRVEIQRHAESCGKCRAAFQAAQFSSVLLQSRSAETFEPPPFFETKILAALREKQVLANPIAAFWRWWQASSVVVFPILLVVITLMALTVFTPQQSVQATVADDFSADTVIFPSGDLNNELTTAQALQILYDQNDSK